MSDDSIRDNLIEVFVAEGNEGLQILETTLRTLDGSMPSADALYEHYRVGHKLKGAAALYQFVGIASLGDLIERVLEHAKATPAVIWPQVVTLLRDLTAALREQLHSLSSAGRELPFNADAWQHRYQSILSSPIEPSCGSSHIHPESEDGDKVWTTDMVLPSVDAEILEYFVPEIMDLLATAEEHTGELSRNLNDPDRIHHLFRAVHTIKGSSYTVGYQAIGDVALPLEDQLRGIRDRREALPASLHQLTIRALGIIRQLIQRKPEQVAELQRDIPVLMDDLRKACEPAPTASTTVPPSLTPTDDPVHALPPHVPVAHVSAVDGPPPVVSPDAETVSVEQSTDLPDAYFLPELDPEVLSYFVPEAQEHLEALESFLLKLEKDPRSTELINQLFRSAHTLKGSAFTVGFTPIGDLVHHVEDLMGAIRENRTHFVAGMTDAILKSVDVVRLLMRRDASMIPQVRNRYRTVVADLKRWLDGSPMIEGTTVPSAVGIPPSWRGPRRKHRRRKTKAAHKVRTSSESTASG